MAVFVPLPHRHCQHFAVSYMTLQVQSETVADRVRNTNKERECFFKHKYLFFGKGIVLRLLDLLRSLRIVVRVDVECNCHDKVPGRDKSVRLRIERKRSGKTYVPIKRSPSK